MAEEEATLRVVELGVRYRAPLGNEQEQAVEVDSGSFRCHDKKCHVCFYILLRFL